MPWLCRLGFHDWRYADERRRCARCLLSQRMPTGCSERWGGFSDEDFNGARVAALAAAATAAFIAILLATFLMWLTR
jgi:hypothetical protein